MSKFVDPLSPEQKCCKTNNVSDKCLDMCVINRGPNSITIGPNDDSILKYCNNFWDTIGRCRKDKSGTNVDV